MRRKAIIAFVLVACYLVVSAPPVAATHGSLAAASEHSSESEFEEGSFTNAAVSDDSVQLYTGSEQIVSRYPLDSTPISDVEGSNAGSAVGSPSVVDGVDGDALNFGGDSHAEVSHDESLTFGPDEEFTVSFFVRFDDDRASNEGLISKGDRNVDQNYQVFLDTHRFRGVATDSNGVQRTGTSAPVESDTWYFVALSRDASGELRLLVDGEEVGSTQLDGVYEGSGDLLIGDGRYWAGELNGTIDEVRIYDDALSEGDIIVNRDTPGSLHADAGAYQSATHSVADAQEVWTDLSLSDATATVEWQGYDGSQWHVVESTTYSSTGNYTADVSEADYEEWRVNVSFKATGSNPTAQLHDEGVLVETDPPTIDNTSLTPNSTDTSTDESVTLSADISDPDFGTSYGDSVEVNWYVDSEQRGTTTASLNGTVEHTISEVGAGEHDWHIEIVDSSGHRTTSADAKFSMPAELRILNESDPESLIDGPNETVELRFFFDEREDDLVVEREVSDGTVNMTNLPVDEPFVLVADAADYRPRRIWVPSLYETQRVFLLPDSESFVSPKFSINDFSGRFSPSETVLLIQRPLNGSWETVQADHFGGTNEVPAQLRLNARHQLVLLNTETGERSDRGQYTPLQSDQKTIEVKESGDFDLRGLDPVVELSPAVGVLPATNESELTVSVFNQSLSFSEWSVTVRYEGNESNETLAEVTRTGPAGGSVSPALNLSDRAGGTVHVVVTWTTDGGETGRETFTRRVQEPFDNQYSLISVLGNVDTLVPEQNVDVFQTMVAVIVSVLVAVTTAAKFRASTEAVGLAAVGSIAGFSLVGWVPSSMLFASGVTMVVFAAYRRGL